MKCPPHAPPTIEISLLLVFSLAKNPTDYRPNFALFQEDEILTEGNSFGHPVPVRMGTTRQNFPILSFPHVVTIRQAVVNN